MQTKVQSAVNRFHNYDLQACIYLNKWSESQRTASFFKKVSRLGDGWIWYGALGVVSVYKGLSFLPTLALLSFGGFVSTMLYKTLKSRTVRPRPYQVHRAIKLGERALDHFSFPSGHTLHAVMISSVLGYVVPALLIVMLPFTILVGISRMVLGLHYPSDVLAGAGLGAVFALVIINGTEYLGFVL